MKRECEQCGADISHKRWSAKWCSETCRNENRIARRYINRPKNCGWCGEEIEQAGRGRPKIYCSDLCGNHSWRHRNPDLWKAVEERSSTKRALQYKAEKALITLSPVSFGVCKGCESAFTVRAHNKLCCSKACYQKLWVSENREKSRDYTRAWARKNRGQSAAYARKRRECHIYSTQARLGRRVREVIGSLDAVKSSNTFDMLGYTPQELTNHIERQFVKGMGWDNRDKWHIDHIVPISTAKTIEDVIALNQLSNLRPLWAHENLSKSAKRTHLL